ncbi:hypothetical protein WB401_15555 [Streptomyces brasiliscabiei]|uniref:Uncharacterized protein n=1 Tax=Streptomyces brasiliscabiei TaxID=2736302 RepID=A0ABU8GJJ5_9ACTN
MRFSWAIWLKDHFGEFGYSHGLFRGAIGTLVVLVTALLIGYTVRHRKPAVGMIAAGFTCVVGIAWLAFH